MFFSVTGEKSQTPVFHDCGLQVCTLSWLQGLPAKVRRCWCRYVLRLILSFQRPGIPTCVRHIAPRCASTQGPSCRLPAYLLTPCTTRDSTREHHRVGHAPVRCQQQPTAGAAGLAHNGWRAAGWSRGVLRVLRLQHPAAGGRRTQQRLCAVHRHSPWWYGDACLRRRNYTVILSSLPLPAMCFRGVWLPL